MVSLQTEKKWINTITFYMDQYMSRKDIILQKGIGKTTRGAKHQLPVNNAITQDCRTWPTNLCTAWIDCKKAEDSMPTHGYWSA